MQDNSVVDLWVIPTPRFSRWFSQLDWYLNWQMCKGLAYGGLHLPAETYRVAEEYGVPVTERAESTSPLLIATEGKVAARKCLVLDGAGSLKTWLAAAMKMADMLQVRNARIFLPTGAGVAEAEKLWKSPCAVQFLADLESTP